MKISMKKDDYEKMLAAAKNAAPLEACGLLAGTMDESGNRTVEFVYILTNVDHSMEHFSLDPKEQLAAIKDMRAHGWLQIGNWHSHPATPSRPSEEDKRLAFDSRASYMILSLADDNRPVLRSFHIENNTSSMWNSKLLLRQSNRNDRRICPHTGALEAGDERFGWERPDWKDGFHEKKQEAYDG